MQVCLEQVLLLFEGLDKLDTGSLLTETTKMLSVSSRKNNEGHYIKQLQKTMWNLHSYATIILFIFQAMFSVCQLLLFISRPKMATFS